MNGLEEIYHLPTPQKTKPKPGTALITVFKGIWKKKHIKMTFATTQKVMTDLFTLQY